MDKSTAQKNDEYRPTGEKEGPLSNVGQTNDLISTREQTVDFLDETKGELYSFGRVPEAVSSDDLTGASLGDFLKRPTLIKTFTWLESGFGETSFDPWTLFFSNSYITNKIQNFAYFRGNLKIKIVVNSSPFYYGALLVSYSPLPNAVIGVASTTSKYITLSQRPHIWIWPQTNSGGELLLPFLYNQNYLDLTTATTVASMGSIRFTQYTPLQSANGATTNGVTIQVYAWCEDSELFGPTHKAALQSKDEYGNGPVSGPATALANISSYMHRIPIIGKYARATTIGASAASDIAKLFGWSNVPVIEDVKPLKNLPFHDIASAHVSEPTSKFTLDPKAELSVDPAIVGTTNEDELSISYLVQKESYLCNFNWNTTDAVSTLYFASKVTPVLQDVGNPSAASTYTIGTTPLSYIAALFRHWRGDIIFRFKIVCTKYHKGRLKVTWDPIGTTNTSSDMSNILMTKIVDLSETDEIEFRVPYMQTLPWSRCNPSWTSNNWSVVGSPPGIANESNGVLNVRCLTNLSAPIDTAPVNVLVFVRGAENLEFANPDQSDANRNVSLFTMQSLNETSGEPDSNQYHINWGEAIPSLRLLLRRSALADEVRAGGPIITTDKIGVLRLFTTKYPPAPGYDPNGWYTAKGVETPANTYNINYSFHTPLEWISAMFVVMRGGVRWHLNFNTDSAGLFSSVNVRRLTNAGLGPPYKWQYNTIAAAGASDSQVAKSFQRTDQHQNGMGGTIVHNLNTQTGISYECPLMTPYRFAFANPKNWVKGVSTDGTNHDTYVVDVTVKPSKFSSDITDTTIQRFVSAGTDFNLHMFFCSPVVYYNANQGNTPV